MIAGMLAAGLYWLARGIATDSSLITALGAMATAFAVTYLFGTVAR